jgi:hypothetical protein
MVEKGGGYICGGNHTLMPETSIENALAGIEEARTFRRTVTRTDLL